MLTRRQIFRRFSRLRSTGGGGSAPAAPTLGIPAAAAGQVSLSWGSVAGASTYSVYRGTSSGSYSLLASGIATTTYDDDTAVNGTTYYYAVTAVNGFGESGYSNERSATPAEEAEETEFSLTVQIAANPDTIRCDAGETVTLTYTISGEGSTSGVIQGPTIGSVSPSSVLNCDGAEHTLTFTPLASGLYFLVVTDDNGTAMDRLEIIVVQDLDAVDPLTVTKTANTGSHNWKDGSAWVGGVVPGVNDVVDIPSGSTITVSDRTSGGNILQCAHLHLYGTLHQDATAGDSILWSSSVTVYDGGHHIQESDSLDRVAVLITRNRPYHASDTGQFYNRFQVDGGSLTMLGLEVTPFMRLAQEPRAGDTSLRLLNPVTNWKQGHLINLPDSRTVNGTVTTSHHEVCVIRGVSSDGLTVYLLRPLQYDHPGAYNPDGSLGVIPHNSEPCLPHAVNMMRNTGIITEDPGDMDTRAYVYMTGGGRVDCRYAVFHGTGQKTIGNSVFDGKWPLLTHNLHGPSGGLGYDATVDADEFKPSDPANTQGLHGPSARFIGCTFMDVFEQRDTEANSIHTRPVALYGIAHLDTFHHYYKGCTSFNFVTGWSTLDSHSAYNVFEDNFVFFTDGHGERIDRDDGNPLFPKGAGGGGWLHGAPQNWFRRNTVANNSFNTDRSRYGLNYFCFNLDRWRIPHAQGVDMWDSANYDDIGSIRKAPVLEWAENETYGNSRAMEVWFVGTGFDNSEVQCQTPSRFYRQVFWNSGNIGCFNYPVTQTTYEEWYCLSDVGGIGIWNTDYLQNGFTLKNCEFRGFGSAFKASNHAGWMQYGPETGEAAKQRMIGCTIQCSVGAIISPNNASFAGEWHGEMHVIIGGDRGSETPETANTFIHLDGVSTPTVILTENPENFEMHNSNYGVTNPTTIELNQYAGHNWDIYNNLQDPSAILVESNYQGGAYLQCAGAPVGQIGKTNQEVHDNFLGLLNGGSYAGTPKPDAPNAATDGLCFWNKLMAITATVQAWLVGGKADQVS